MDYPNVDKLFIEEMNNHNNVIAMASSLQSALIAVSKYGLDINNFLSTVLDHIQKKEYDNAAKVLTDVVYSIEQLAGELGTISYSIRQGVLKVYEQESQRIQKPS